MRLPPAKVSCLPHPARPDFEPNRRQFLAASGLALGSLALSRLPAMAGPFTRADFNRLVPEDKRLSPDWVKSLFERGARAVYRGAELEKIGMPVGGICCGQVYLGGDGRLWHWDIFNQHIGTGAEHYAKPMQPHSPFEQGFAVRITSRGATQVRTLDRAGWRDVSFNGEYPLGFIEYRDAGSPVTVSLEAFSPFVPLEVEASSLPATIMRFTLRNTGAEPVEAELAGWLENPVCLHSGELRLGLRRNDVVRRDAGLLLACGAEALPAQASGSERPDILFDDFERARYETWTATGTAFGQGPVARTSVPDYQGDLGASGEHAVNSHASASGQDVGARDAQIGTLTSQPFRIERNFITFLLGGGAHRNRTCVNLLVEDEVVLSATGANSNRMQARTWPVRRWAGKTARLQLVDNETGGWGNIGLDRIVFTDRPATASGNLADEADFGTMTLALLKSDARSPKSEPSPNAGTREAGDDDFGVAALAPGRPSEVVFAPGPAGESSVARPFDESVTGAVGRRLKLAPGESGTVTFVLTWHFPNLRMDRLPPGRHYATRFASATEVAGFVAERFHSLRERTQAWHDTWYDSTLPYWFLDRTFLNTSILATATCHRFGNGRFWGWEGVGCCHGTCGHVWQYAHAVARLFPDLERDTRERVDFGLAQQPDGAIRFRAEHNDIPAIDAQAGTVLRALREHQVGSDDAWLRRNWPAVKRALEWLMGQDGDGDGLIVGNQHNTLDTDWYGPVAWLSGLYLAAVRAGEVMARETGDPEFAQRCRVIFERGQKQLVAELFDGEYFINRPDPAHADAINSGTGCHIDQVMGQSWAWQVGLGRVLPQRETLAALKALWRYNFTPDVGPYRDAYKPGRWYAMPGEGGLLMCTFPRSDWDYAQAKGKGPDWAAGYFNECMNGFEYQVAGHMIAEGLVMEGLAVTRMVHDRYHPSRRNPWNEVECGDHYARSMASYGVFLAACGFEYHGPEGRIAFAPRIRPEDFRCAFTAAEGWGTFAQAIEGGRQRASFTCRWGLVRLARIGLQLGADIGLSPGVKAMHGNRGLSATLRVEERRVEVILGEPVALAPGETLTLELG